MSKKTAYVPPPETEETIHTNKNGEHFKVGDVCRSTLFPDNPPFKIIGIIKKKYLHGERRKDNQWYFENWAHIDEATKQI